MDTHERGTELDAEQTLDPTTDEGWEALRGLGHRMVDNVVALVRGPADHRRPFASSAA